jgi:hypothetical protein
MSLTANNRSSLYTFVNTQSDDKIEISTEFTVEDEQRYEAMRIRSC